jgi:hypothetical protein
MSLPLPDLTPLNRWLSEHSRREATPLSTLLVIGAATFGMTAFGVSPLTVTEPPPVAPRQIVETLPTRPDWQQQVQTQQDWPLALRQSTLLRRGDTADTLLSRLGVPDAEAATALRQSPVMRAALNGTQGQIVRASFSRRGVLDTHLISLEIIGPAQHPEQRLSHYTLTELQRIGSGDHGAGRFEARTRQQPLQARQQGLHAHIDSDLFEAIDRAGWPEDVALQLADIFGSELDFRRELEPGDTLSAICETPVLDGETPPWIESAPCHVTAARVSHGALTREAFWYQEPGQRGRYYSADGHSPVRQFLASPMALSRVTSGFERRIHPILKQWRAHLGIDYGAPRGTPVRSVGDGQVAWAGWKPGYGQIVLINHGQGRETVYAHLSRTEVRTGQTITQGQRLGAVGMTGWATGPHLHFEFRIDGHQIDPAQAARQSVAYALPGSARPRFVAAVAPMREQLASLNQQDPQHLASVWPRATTIQP